MDRYERLEEIGRGSFGSVFKVRRKSDKRILCWKEIEYGRMQEREKQQLVAEVNALSKLRHPNIVKYYEKIIDKEARKLYIVMEYCANGDMAQLIKKCRAERDFVAEDVIWKIFMQVLLALRECHAKRPPEKPHAVLHRDLKPGNLFFDQSNNVKLGDFGLCRILTAESQYAHTGVGTPYYMSPEQIKEANYDAKTDVWSLGCVLFEMVALRPPFQASNHLELARKIIAGDAERIPTRYSEDLQQVVGWMIQKDAEKRPSVDELIELPKIQLRLRERQMREDYAELKQREADVHQRYDSLKVREHELATREHALQRRQADARNKKISLAERAMKIKAEQVLRSLQRTNNNSTSAAAAPLQPLAPTATPPPSIKNQMERCELENYNPNKFCPSQQLTNLNYQPQPNQQQFRCGQPAPQENPNGRPNVIEIDPTTQASQKVRCDRLTRTNTSLLESKLSDQLGSFKRQEFQRENVSLAPQEANQNSSYSPQQFNHTMLVQANNLSDNIHTNTRNNQPLQKTSQLLLHRQTLAENLGEQPKLNQLLTNTSRSMRRCGTFTNFTSNPDSSSAAQQRLLSLEQQQSQKSKEPSGHATNLLQSRCSAELFQSSNSPSTSAQKRKQTQFCSQQSQNLQQSKTATTSMIQQMLQKVKRSQKPKLSVVKRTTLDLKFSEPKYALAPAAPENGSGFTTLSTGGATPSSRNLHLKKIVNQKSMGGILTQQAMGFKIVPQNTVNPIKVTAKPDTTQNAHFNSRPVSSSGQIPTENKQTALVSRLNSGGGCGPFQSPKQAQLSILKLPQQETNSMKKSNSLITLGGERTQKKQQVEVANNDAILGLRMSDCAQVLSTTSAGPNG